MICSSSDTSIHKTRKPNPALRTACPENGASVYLTRLSLFTRSIGVSIREHRMILEKTHGHVAYDHRGCIHGFGNMCCQT